MQGPQAAPAPRCKEGISHLGARCRIVCGPARQLPAVQASLPLTEQAKCRDFLHVLAARDEPAAPVVVVCCCITLCLSLCGSLWWCGVCRRGRSEWRSECAVTFHRVCMVWGHVYYDSKHSDSPGHVSTKQGHLWRKQLVECCGESSPLISGFSYLPLISGRSVCCPVFVPFLTARSCRKGSLGFAPF